MGRLDLTSGTVPPPENKNLLYNTNVEFVTHYNVSQGKEMRDGNRILRLSVSSFIMLKIFDHPVLFNPIKRSCGT
jgi:hypothetical protein